MPREISDSIRFGSRTLHGYYACNSAVEYRYELLHVLFTRTLLGCIGESVSSGDTGWGGGLVEWWLLLQHLANRL